MTLRLPDPVVSDPAVQRNLDALALAVVTPVSPDPANPDTTGATLAALEAEVNELKATLRTHGLIL